VAGLLAGCGRTGRLETGYAYRAINDTEPERRAYYTDPYSDEAFEASLAAERDEGFGGAGGVGPR